MGRGRTRRLGVCADLSEFLRPSRLERTAPAHRFDEVTGAAARIHTSDRFRRLRPGPPVSAAASSRPADSSRRADWSSCCRPGPLGIGGRVGPAEPHRATGAGRGVHGVEDLVESAGVFEVRCEAGSTSECRRHGSIRTRDVPGWTFGQTRRRLRQSVGSWSFIGLSGLGWVHELASMECNRFRLVYSR